MGGYGELITSLCLEEVTCSKSLLSNGSAWGDSWSQCLPPPHKTPRLGIMGRSPGLRTGLQWPFTKCFSSLRSLLSLLVSQDRDKGLRCGYTAVGPK